MVLPGLLHHRTGHRASQIATAAVLISPLIALCIVAAVFGVKDALRAVEQAHPILLAVAVTLGIAIQIARAVRARALLAPRQTVTLPQCYGPMVIGHGLGDLVPLAPGGPVLRSVLTERLARIPIPFSAGAFMTEGVLDGVGMALLGLSLLAGFTVPQSAHAHLIWVLLPLLLLGGLIAGGLLLRRSMARTRSREEASRARRWLREMALGLTTAFGQGPGACMSLLAQSLLITALSGLQIAVFLYAFGLNVSLRSLIILVVLTLGAGSLPIKFPGSGTLTATATLSLSGIHGAGVAGYLLVSRAVLSSTSPVLAAALLGWWVLTGFGRLSGLLAIVQQSMLAPSPAGKPAMPPGAGTRIALPVLAHPEVTVRGSSLERS